MGTQGKRPSAPLVLAQDEGQRHDDDAQQDGQDEGHRAPLVAYEGPAHWTPILVRTSDGPPCATSTPRSAIVLRPFALTLSLVQQADEVLRPG